MQIIIVKPIITETSMKDANSGKFTFEVSSKADKTQIKREVEKMFPVNVIGVSTSTLTRLKVINTKFGRKSSKNKVKKARVELRKGQTIPAFETQDEGKKGKKDKKKEEK